MVSGTQWRVRDLTRRIAASVIVALAGASVAAQPALAQGDTQPPRVISFSPSAGGAGVSVTITVTAAFSEPVQPASIAFVLRDASNAIVPSSLTYNAATRTVTLDPQGDLQPGKTYTATLSAAADLAGNALSPPVVWSFTTHPGFQETVVFSGLLEPTSIQFAPDGRVFVAEKSGLIKVFDSLLTTTPTVFADLRTKVYNHGGSGLLGMALDPTFPALPYIYVLYTYDAPIGGTAPVWGDGCPPANADQCAVSGRLSRLRVSGNVMIGTEQVLVADWFQRYPDQPIGGLAFGPDGALYARPSCGSLIQAQTHGRRSTSWSIWATATAFRCARSWRSLVGSSAKARRVLGWVPQFADLERIIETAWRWHRDHSRSADSRGYGRWCRRAVHSGGVVGRQFYDSTSRHGTAIGVDPHSRRS
jgi:hypothetical protein